MAIPDIYRTNLIPRPNLSVKDFLSMGVPAKRAALVHVTASKQFTSNVPLTDAMCLQTRKLPSLEFVEDAAKSIGQALLNDAQSIMDPDYKGPGLLLWVVQYWIEKHKVLRMRALWQGNLDWLERHSGGSGAQESLDQSHALLLALPWTVQLCAQGPQEIT